MRTFFKNLITITLTLIAKGILLRHRPKVIAVTGSVGKTSTKDAIYTVLRGAGSVRRSEKSFNSELGVPLSIIGAKSGWNSAGSWLGIVASGIWQILEPKGRYPKTLVLEVGADRPGDISSIARWIKPHIVVITCLPAIPVHIEFFPTLASLIEEKLSLARGLRKDGTLILNADDERIMAAADKLRFKTITYGVNEHAMIRASNVQLLAPSETHPDGGLAFKADFDGKSFPVILPNIYGESYMSIALAALSVAYAMGVNIVTAIGDIAEYQTPPGRVRLIAGVGDTVLIDDTYNSSPAACEAGLRMLKDIPFGKRKVAVIGDMLELGRHTSEAHFEVGKLAKKSAQILVTVGMRAEEISRGALEAGMSEKKVFHAENAREAADMVRELMKTGDVIYIKGSQGMRMENTVKALMFEPERAGELLVRQEKEWERR
jgi:UDP-N-acetylmuramoyl-tripeptide--D-alanyl-D-alanine ligase